MAHLSEVSRPLQVIQKHNNKLSADSNTPTVELVVLPYFKAIEDVRDKEKLYQDLFGFLNTTNCKSTVCILTSPVLAADLCASLVGDEAQLKLWITVKLANPIVSLGTLTQSHAALLVFTRYKSALNHTKTRIGYTYCPACDKTTKDYGGKKHLYNEYGTLMSDVWRDISINFDEYPTEVIERLRDVFGLPEYENLIVHDIREDYKVLKGALRLYKTYTTHENVFIDGSVLLNGDCVEQLSKIPDNSIDFAFADPPYNIKKKYESWNDGIDIQEYFDWCDKWLSELARVLKPGRTLAVLNIPQWCIRHFKHLRNILDYQDWIVWEGLSMPVRMIMPAHYSILCMSKGMPRSLPGSQVNTLSASDLRAITTPIENFCARPNCIKSRRNAQIKDTELTTNIWWDVHRLKHNSRRVDHPCQLPPNFMYRLIAEFTQPGEIVLDPFNGAGTTSLTAEQLGRRYVGIELSDYYHNITTERHRELGLGLDPFRKNNDDGPKAKNSRVQRVKKQKYEVSKKVLQLKVKEIANKLGRIPTVEEVTSASGYPIEYYEHYFVSWAEVCAAVRNTGMIETRNKEKEPDKQLSIF